ncbi:MAG: oligosaccharide flippase family protein [Flavobacteriales bacterium]|nr:oligosaccharide flippase family protein [Flavobacteriales bacterium]MCB9197015.1 oligosaccharide flippase family protein [Flavobacteriales bacterium]
MGEISKQGSWNTLLMYSGAVLGALNMILLYPNFMSKEDYGLIALITTIAMTLSGFGSFGTPTAIIRFLPEYYRSENKGAGSLVTFLLKISLSFSLIITLLLIVFQNLVLDLYHDGAQMLSSYYYFIVPVFFAEVFVELLSNLLNGLKKSTFQVFQKEIFLRVGQTVLLLLFYYELISFDYFVAMYTGLYVISMLLLIGYIYTIEDIQLISSVKLEKVERKRIWDYLGFTFLASIARQLAFRIDSMMIAAMVVSVYNPNRGLEAAGIYAVALNIAVMVELPFRALNQMLSPAIAKAWVEDNLSKVEELYVKSTETMLVIGSYITLGIWACVDELLKILPSTYYEVKYVLWWLLIGKLINVATGANGIVMINSPRYKMVTVLSFVGLILTVVSNLIFINIFSIEGAAIATFLTYVLINTVFWWMLKLHYNLQPFNWKNIVVIVLSISIYVLIMLLPEMNPIMSIIVKAGLITITFWSVALFLKLSPELVDFFAKMRNQLK